MDLSPIHKRVMAMDVHQAKITACAVVEHDDCLPVMCGVPPTIQHQ